MPTYPVSPQLTVNALLKQPRIISRDLLNLAVKRLIADKLFVRGTADQVAGGAMRYQQLESIYLDVGPDVEEIAPRADWPRTGWTELLKTAAVQQFGLEVPISNLAIRRHQMDQVTRAERKLANNLVRFIDTQAMALLASTAATASTPQVQAASALWSNIATDVIGDLAVGQELLETKDNAYAGFEGATLILHTTMRKNLLKNTGLRSALPRETQNGQIQTGMLAPFLGLKEILFTPQIASTKAILMDTGIAGTIADEQPDPLEGFAAYDPGPGFAPIYVKVYEEPRSKDKVIAAGRWPAMALIQPDAVVVFTGVQ